MQLQQLLCHHKLPETGRGWPMTSVTILHHIGLLPMYIRHLYIRTRKMSFNQNKQTIVKSLTLFPNASLHLNHCPPPKRGKKRNSPSGHFSRHPEISISQPLSLSTHNTFGDSTSFSNIGLQPVCQSRLLQHALKTAFLCFKGIKHLFGFK